MGYIIDNLMNDEKVIHMAKIHWFIYVPGIIILTIAILILDGLSSVNELKPVAYFIGGSLFIISLVTLISAFIFSKTTELAVTTKRVIAKTGLIKRDTLELNHSKVESFSVEQSILGRILNFGNVVIRGTGGGLTPIPNIDDPLLFRKKAMETIDKVENNSSTKSIDNTSTVNISDKDREELRSLIELKDLFVISNKEFEEKKENILSKYK